MIVNACNASLDLLPLLVTLVEQLIDDDFPGLRVAFLCLRLFRLSLLQPQLLHLPSLLALAHLLHDASLLDVTFDLRLLSRLLLLLDQTLLGKSLVLFLSLGYDVLRQLLRNGLFEIAVVRTQVQTF